MIEINNVCKKFGQVEVLKNLNLSINKSGVFAVLGPNGSGKTTMIKSLLGIVLLDEGTIKIKGENVYEQSEYKRGISYLPQIANFPTNLSVKELIQLIKNIRNQPANELPLIETFGLEPYLDKKLGNLSGGTKQKVNIVLAFMFDNDLIILDEPTTGLDPIALIKLKDLIRTEQEKGKIVLITTHIMSFVEEIADKVVFLLDGKIYFKGSLQELYDETKKQNVEQAIAELLQK